VSWSSKRQPTVSRSNAEAEYRRVANAVAESSWLCQLLTELGHPPRRATIVFCDNVCASYMSMNHVHHQRTKHTKINLHFVRDKVSLGDIKVLHVPSSSQYADIFTKGLPMTLFQDFRFSLNLYPYPGWGGGGGGGVGPTFFVLHFSPPLPPPPPPPPPSTHTFVYCNVLLSCTTSCVILLLSRIVRSWLTL
jgi:hypothetical protein